MVEMENPASLNQRRAPEGNLGKGGPPEQIMRNDRRIHS